MKYQIVFLFAFLFVLPPAQAQELVSVPFDSDQWEIAGDNTKLVNYKGQPALFAKGGAAVLNDVAFLNGIIEFDLAIAENRGFPGVFFRMEDDSNFEEFYVRPHQSGNPDASQYAPINNGISGWQLYHGEGYSGQMSYEFDTWMPVRLVVKGDKADVYVNDLQTPLLHINDLKRAPFAGGIGVKGSPGDVYFANFRYTTEEPEKLVGHSTPQAPASEITVTRWAVSEAFDEAVLDGKTHLEKGMAKGLQWRTFDTEPSGMINLATTAVRTDETNTVLARLSLNSNQEQIKKMTFAFSDRIRIYLNGRILYSGRDEFRSRDYRYLGTIGNFDDVYLPLEKGQNELLIAVSENFGGWALRAEFENKEGLSWSTR